MVHYPVTVIDSLFGQGKEYSRAEKGNVDRRICTILSNLSVFISTHNDFYHDRKIMLDEFKNQEYIYDRINSTRS